MLIDDLAGRYISRIAPRRQPWAVQYWGFLTDARRYPDPYDYGLTDAEVRPIMMRLGHIREGRPWSNSGQNPAVHWKPRDFIFVRPGLSLGSRHGYCGVCGSDMAVHPKHDKPSMKGTQVRGAEEFYHYNSHKRLKEQYPGKTWGEIEDSVARYRERGGPRRESQRNPTRPTLRWIRTSRVLLEAEGPNGKYEIEATAGIHVLVFRVADADSLWGYGFPDRIGVYHTIPDAKREAVEHYLTGQTVQQAWKSR